MSTSPEIRTVLQTEWENRRKRNPGYSLRSFARALKLSPSYLSMLLSGKRPFSEVQVHRVCEALGLTAVERQRLLVDFKLSSSSTHSETQYYQERLQEVSKKKDPFKQMKESETSLFSRWYYPAIYELWVKKKGKLTAETIAKRLRIPLLEAQVSFLRLKEAGFLSEDPPASITSGSIKSETIRLWQKAMLEKAKSAISTQAQDQREFSYMILMIDRKKLPEAKARIKEFRKEMIELLGTDNADELYALGLQLFSLEDCSPSVNKSVRLN